MEKIYIPSRKRGMTYREFLDSLTKAQLAAYKQNQADKQRERRRRKGEEARTYIREYHRKWRQDPKNRERIRALSERSMAKRLAKYGDRYFPNRFLRCKDPARAYQIELNARQRERRARIKANDPAGYQTMLERERTSKRKRSS